MKRKIFGAFLQNGGNKKMKKILCIFAILVLTGCGSRCVFANPAYVTTAEGAELYDAYDTAGRHLIISDNGTPADTDDDWIVDWEYR